MIITTTPNLPYEPRTSLYFTLKEGFFHADPHPGNVFVTEDGTVALIDFGQMKRIGYKFRREFAELVVMPGLKDHIYMEDANMVCILVFSYMV